MKIKNFYLSKTAKEAFSLLLMGLMVVDCDSLDVLDDGEIVLITDMTDAVVNNSYCFYRYDKKKDVFEDINGDYYYGDEAFVNYWVFRLLNSEDGE